MPYKYKFVRERIGEKITDPSQLVGWRDRRLEREERERQAELERQRELERRRAAGEIIPEDDVPASTSTSATARRRNSFALRPETRPLTERPMTRTVARAIAMAATSDDASANTAIASTPAADDVEVEAPIFPSASSPTTASPAALPVVSAIDVDEEHREDGKTLDQEAIEPVNYEIGQEQISSPMITKDSEKPSDRKSASISPPASVHVGNTPTSLQTIATTANPQAYPPAYPPVSSPVFASVFGPVIGPATVGTTPSDASEYLEMGILDPALFEPIDDENIAQEESAPNVANEKTVEPTVFRESKRDSRPNNGQAGNVPTNRPTIFEDMSRAGPTITIPALRSVFAPVPAPVFTLATVPAPTPVVAPVATPAAAPATTPATVAAPAVEVEKHTAAKLPEPVTGGNAPVQTVFPSAAEGNQQMTQPAAGQSEARVKAAYQLVPVVDIVNRLFVHCLAQLQSPTPEMVTSEARLFLARARENETEQAVKKAAMTLSSVTKEKIDELTRRPDQFEVVSEILKLRLQQVFLQGLLK